MNIASFRYTVQEDEPFRDAVPSREAIAKLEDAIRQLPPVEAPVSHHFSPGIYAREMFIPRGTVLTGKIHLTDHLCLITQGDISVLTESGVKRLKAGAVVHTKAGMKRAGYAHEDTRWVTVHATDETDVDLLEATLVADEFSDPRVEAIERKRITA